MKHHGIRLQRGQATLIGLLVVICIIAILAAVYYPRIAASHSAPGQPPTPRERAYGANCDLYASQVNDAVEMYRENNDGKSPQNLNELRSYGITDDVINSPGCYFKIDPETGSVRDYGHGNAPPVTVGANGQVVRQGQQGQSSDEQPSSQPASGTIRIPNLPAGGL